MPYLPLSWKVGRFIRRSPLVLALLTGCNHQEPFPSGSQPNLGPRTPGLPRQLTYAVTNDINPAWVADGSALAYSFVKDTSGDRCLGVLPAQGGTRLHQKCLLRDFTGDTIETLTWPAPALDGRRAAWVDLRRFHSHLSPDRGFLRVGTLASPDTGVAVQSIPYLAPSGNLYFLTTHIGWLGSSRLVYIGSDVLYPATTVVGLEVAILDFSTTPATVTVVPNTAGATSVVPSTDGLSINYTLAGNTRVLRQELSTGAVSTVFDFAGLGVPSGISLRDNQLLAVVGSGLSARIIQVDLASSTLSPVALEAGPVEQVRLSPDRRFIVSQVVDTLAPSISENLWLVAAP